MLILILQFTRILSVAYATLSELQDQFFFTKVSLTADANVDKNLLCAKLFCIRV